MPETHTFFEVQAGTIRELQKRGGALFAEHHAEAEASPDLMNLDVNWDRYAALERAGLVRVLLVWSGGESVGTNLVGYSVLIIDYQGHNRDQAVAMVDAIFIREPFRHHGAGTALIEASEDAAREAGAVKIITHARKGERLARLLSRRAGYKLDYEIYGRQL